MRVTGELRGRENTKGIRLSETAKTGRPERSARGQLRTDSGR